jgi:mevalonate kinase
MSTASAPGKIILCGEHAVVYGRPAIAVPVWEAQARATVAVAAVGSGCAVVAHDLSRRFRLAAAPADDPLALIVRLTLAHLQLPPEPDWRIEVRSELPIASGLGSGAAVSTAIVRAIAAHTGRKMTPDAISALVYRSEELYHGTPSGIDNAVIAHGQPVWFVRGQPPYIFAPASAFSIVIADSGVASPTRETVGDVRRAWQAGPDRLERLFDAMGAIALAVRQAMEQGRIGELGPLFDRNQDLLAQIGVSSPNLELLIQAARKAGAAGAKLSGGGRGGNIIALVDEEWANGVIQALLAAGARRVLTTTVPGPAT